MHLTVDGCSPAHRRVHRADPMDHEMLSRATTTTPAVMDACGCTPHTPLVGGTVAVADLQPAPTPSPGAAAESEEHIEPLRRPLKLVVTLTPAEGGQYRAALTLGAEDCDPLLRSTTVSALADALEQVPGLLDEAEAHWRLHPRNPTATRAPARRSGNDRPRSDAAAPRPRTDEPSPVSVAGGRADDPPPTPPVAEPTVTSQRPTGGQLTLFG